MHDYTHDGEVYHPCAGVPDGGPAQMAAGISAFRGDLGRRAMSGYVIHPGGVRLPLGPDAIALPFRDL